MNASPRKVSVLSIQLRHILLKELLTTVAISVAAMLEACGKSMVSLMMCVSSGFSSVHCAVLGASSAAR